MALTSKSVLVNEHAAMRSFKGLMRSANKVIQGRFDEVYALRVHETAKKEFADLIGDIPYVGGRKNYFSDMLVKAAVILALYRALKKEGVTMEAFGHILEEITTVYMNSFPAWVRKLAGKLWLSSLFSRLFTKQSAISQLRNYEGDFVYEVVPGDGSYKWGINYTECGIAKFMIQQGEPELAKYACILDYLMFPAIGVNLQRSGTIANGCEYCDFRFS